MKRFLSLRVSFYIYIIAVYSSFRAFLCRSPKLTRTPVPLQYVILCSLYYFQHTPASFYSKCNSTAPSCRTLLFLWRLVLQRSKLLVPTLLQTCFAAVPTHAQRRSELLVMLHTSSRVLRSSVLVRVIWYTRFCWPTRHRDPPLPGTGSSY